MQINETKCILRTNFEEKKTDRLVISHTIYNMKCSKVTIQQYVNRPGSKFEANETT